MPNKPLSTKEHPVGRRGPKPSAGSDEGAQAGSTRERILNAAKRIYRERNFAGVRTADITEASGANVALVNYYFGSKNRLFLQVFAEACETVARERERELDELLARSSAPDMASLVRAWMAPVFAQTQTEEARMLASHLLGLVLASDINESIREVFGESLSRIDGRYAQQFRRLRPDLSAEAVAWRMLSALGAYSLVLGHPGLIELMGEVRGPGAHKQIDVQDELFRWLVAAMDAPAASATPASPAARRSRR